MVGIPKAGDRLNDFRTNFWRDRQRVMIAMALSW